MKFLLLWLLLFLCCIVSYIHCYCIYNYTPNTEVWYKTYSHRGDPKKRIVSADDKSCCIWNEDTCYKDLRDRNWYDEKPSGRHVHVTVEVACSRWRDNLQYTSVRFPAGGYLIVRDAVTPGDDHYIDVYGHLGDLKKWYRCGTDDSGTSY